MSQVSVAQGEFRKKAVREAVDGLGNAFVDKVKAARNILIVPNVSHCELQLASVHVDAIRAVIDAIRLHSRVPITIGAAGDYGTKAAFRHFGYENLPNEYDKLTLADLADDAIVESTVLDHAIRRPKTAMTADFVISIAPLKTHHAAKISLTIENWVFNSWIVPARITSVGSVATHEPWLAGEGTRDAMIAELYAQKPCDMAIIDGVMAMEGDGPIHGIAVRMNVVLAGFDAVAVDTVGTALMGFDAQSIPYLSHIAALNLGTNTLSKIDVPLSVITSLSHPFTLPSA